MSAPQALHLERVTKTFGRETAVADVTLDVPAGSYVVLLGPSGSGKTTLLSMIGGFTLPSSGLVRIGGADVTAVPPARRPTATVFQDYALFPHLSVIRNVAFGLSVRGVPRPEQDRRAREALAMVGLEGFEGRSIAALSGGQRQRVALARALVVEPAILLLDEPLGALDLNLRRQMQDELKALQVRTGRSFIHVTHDQEEAMALGDLVVVMNRGRVDDVGPPERVYARPATRFSARFMGESTLLEGTVAAVADGLVEVSTRDGRLRVEGRAEVGSAVAVAVRPERLVLGPAGGHEPLVRATVTETVFQGGFVRVKGRTPSGAAILAKVAPEDAPPVGAVVTVHARRHDLVLLEGDAG